ncbi:MAG: 23S rRNA (pseudouridine(1915)-N(3))-methyltransferase RlmH [Pelagibacteraceae bacterium]|nr:23S rRNA (pseudouridine(1915)-N(3))-methyltransferase RlmH [Pelagibacteraceae bacterium]
MCEGRINKNPEKELCNLYSERINSIKNSGISFFEIKQASKKEINNILSKKNPQTTFIVLDEKGKMYSSINFAKKIQSYLKENIKNLYLFIGRPEGISFNFQDVETISLSNFTFSHSLTRVILCEQFYRCATILTNHPYHKD